MMRFKRPTSEREVMCQDNYHVSEMLRAVSTMQVVTFVACAVCVLVTALTNGCTGERLARIEAKANIEPMKIVREKGE